MESTNIFKELIGKRGYYAELSILVERKIPIKNYPQIIFNGLNKEYSDKIIFDKVQECFLITP